MKKALFLIILSVLILKAGECYSIRTQTGLFTPVYPYNFKDNMNYIENKCEIFSEDISWESNLSYVGCYRYKKDAEYALKTMKFNFKNPEIIKHKIRFDDQYVIFPSDSKVSEKNINRLLLKYKPSRILKKFPTKFYGNSFDIINLHHVTFLPSINLYEVYRYCKKHGSDDKLLVLYNGVYNLEMLRKLINNKDIIEKRGRSYVIKIPIYISPTAKLVISNKRVLLETKKIPAFILGNGDMYFKNSEFLTWDSKRWRFAKREHIPEEELLLIGKQDPRPYILGLAGSKTYFVNNTFTGLGYHSTVATFGIGLLNFPKIMPYTSLLSIINRGIKPTGAYIGNTMYKNMMGFYCSEADRAVLIGNLMYDNKIYNIDPHDYSNHLIIARNITARARHAHGIVVSRQVDYTVIAQNMSFNNHSAGIMLDRLSNHNLIYDNLSFSNGFMGVSIQESDDNLISKNKIIGNKIDGIIVRNSLRNSIRDNLVYLNKKNGIEVLSKDLSRLIYRNNARDPYHIATSANLQKNIIMDNINNNIFVKNNAAIKLINNEIVNRVGGSNYGGEIGIFTKDIETRGGNFTLYGIGRPYRPVSIDLIKVSRKVLKEMERVYIDSSCDNSKVSPVIADIRFKLRENERGIKELVRGSSRGVTTAMRELGYYLLDHAKSKEDEIRALSYLTESSILSNNDLTKVELTEIRYFKNVNEDDINRAFEIALERLRRGDLVESGYYDEYKCKKDVSLIADVESKVKLFEYFYKKSGAKSYFDYCMLARKNFTVFTPEVVKKINYVFAKANIPKIRYFKKQKTYNKLITHNDECKDTFFKWNRVNEGLEYKYKLNKKKIGPVVSKYLDAYLNMVNEYRTKKVDTKTIYNLMQEFK